MSGLLCAGNVHVAILNDDGSFGGFLDIKNAIKLSLKPGEGEEKQRLSKQRDNYGAVLDAVTIPTPDALGLEFDEGDAETVGLAMAGQVTPLQVASVTRTDVDLEVTALDTWLELGDRRINPTGFAIKNEAGTTTYVLGEDYVVDLTMGLIKFLSSGDIALDDTVTKSYTTRAVTGTRVTAGPKRQLRLRLLGSMKNLANGRHMEVNIPDSTFKTTSEVDLLSGEFAVTTLTGTPRGNYTLDYIDTGA